MHFSVLMSVYYKDNPQWLKQAIESVLNNTIKPNEILVAVDGPIDNELKNILQEYEKNIPNFRNVFLPENKGRGEALNKVLPMCKYDLVALMDADDINLPTRFELLLKEFENNPNLTIVGGYIQEFNSQTSEKTSIRKVPLEDNKIKQYCKTRSPFNNVTVMFKKKDILQVGNYQSFYQMEDYYLWARLVKANFQMKNISQLLVNVRVDPKMFARRGGYKYFKSNKEVSKQMLKMKIINYPYYLFNITIRFITQVLMPNNIRTLFYKKVLR